MAITIPYGSRGLLSLYLIQRESKLFRVSAQSIFSIRPSPDCFKYGRFQTSRISRLDVGKTYGDLEGGTRVVVKSRSNRIWNYQCIDRHSPEYWSFILISSRIYMSWSVPTGRTDIVRPIGMLSYFRIMTYRYFNRKNNYSDTFVSASTGTGSGVWSSGTASVCGAACRTSGASHGSVETLKVDLTVKNLDTFFSYILISCTSPPLLMVAWVWSMYPRSIAQPYDWLNPVFCSIPSPST